MNGNAIGVVPIGGNLFSLLRGLRAAGLDPVPVEKPEQLAEHERVVLPGVGAFAAGMRALERRGLDAALREYAASGRSLFGICLGAQLLLARGTEHGRVPGLGLIDGEVVPLPPGAGQRIPHVGWAPLVDVREDAGSALCGCGARAEMYFTHSYVCRPSRESDVLARFDFGPQRCVAAVGRGNVQGVQFHPELSARAGLRVLRNLLGL